MTVITGTLDNDVFTGSMGDDVFHYGDVVFDAQGQVVLSARGFDTVSAGDGGFDTVDFDNLPIDHIYGYRDGDDFVLLVMPTTNWTDEDAQSLAIGGVRLTGMTGASGVGLIERIDFADAHVLLSQDSGALRLQIFDAQGVLIQSGFVGTTANDTLVGNDSTVPDFLEGLGGDDSLQGLAGDDELDGGDGNDVLDGGSGADLLWAGAGNDVLIAGGETAGIASNDWLDGEGGFDTADYSFANGSIQVNLQFQDGHTVTDGAPVFGAVASTNVGTDILWSIERVIGSVFNDLMEGSAAADTLEGGAGNDHLRGGEGNDGIDGGTGDDNLWGGSGNDSIGGGDGNDYVDGFDGDDSMDGGAGDRDMVSFIAMGGSTVGVVASLAAGTSTGGAGNDVFVNFEDLQGSDFTDVLTGDAGRNIIIGRAGADTINGGDGNDDLFGFLGNIGEGGEGVDGNDTIDGGAGNDILRGNFGDDTLLGGAGDDNLRGDAGNDTLDGGEGTDGVAYRFDERTDLTAGVNFDASVIGTAQELQFADGRGGIDTLRSIEFVIATGSNFDDTLTGSVGGDQISGMAGNDLIIGGLGDDFALIGGDGNDSILGGQGNDVLYGNAGENYLNGGEGADELDGTGGYSYAVYSDAVSGVSAYLTWAAGNSGEAAGDGYFAIEGMLGSSFADVLSGNEVDNVISGNDGNDWLFGREGQDVLYGDAGNDVLSGGSGSTSNNYGGDLLDGGDGTDVAYYRDAPESAFRVIEVGNKQGMVDGRSYGISIDVANGANNFGEATGDVLVNVENIWGSRFDDIIRGDDNVGGQVYGFEGDDILEGRGGDDVFYGGTGADILTGGAGAEDFFYLSYNDHYNQYGTLEAYEGGDTITDFEHGVDHITVSRYWFGFGNIGGPAAALTSEHADFINQGSEATSSKPTFFWNSATGELLFDADGTGDTAAVNIATLTGGATLTLADIWTA